MSAALDHVTLRTADLEGHRAFFEDVLELTVGYRPDFGFPGYWLYAGAHPVVHLIPGNDISTGKSPDAIDHAAFCVTDYEAVRARLANRGLPVSETRLAELGERRLFVTMPGNARIELIVRDRP